MMTEYKWVDTRVLFDAMRDGWRQITGANRLAGDNGLEIWMERNLDPLHKPTQEAKEDKKKGFGLAQVKKEGVTYDLRSEEDLIHRLMREYNKIGKKINKLGAVLQRDYDGAISDEELFLMRDQSDAMLAYKSALSDRLSLHLKVR